MLRAMSLRHALLAAALCAGCASPTPRIGCTTNVDCKVGSYCMGGTCRTECRGDFDCPGARCDPGLGRCVGSDGGASPSDGGAPPSDGGAPPDMAVAPWDFATPEGDDMAQAPAALGYGDPCSADGQCASMICSRNPWANGDRECLGACTPGAANDGCMPADFCIGAISECAQSDIGAQCNQNMMGADCRGGACLGAQGQPNTNFCTRICNSAADCPSGYSCSSVSGKRVCVNLDATGPCASDGNCIYSTYCDVANQRCLGDCRSDADCPLEHSCNGQLGNHVVCVPKASGGGGIEAPCMAANDCRSGACYANKCIDRCGVTTQVGQWCPGGYGCNPVDDGMGGSVLLCVPAGTGSLGAPCVDNSSCATGLCLTDNNNQRYCSRFCNSAPCPAALPHCLPVGVVADGVNLMACSK